MSEHLSPRQISEAILGERGVAIDQHLRACSTCRTAVRRAQDDLSIFGSVVRSWGDRENASTILPRAVRRRDFSFPKLLGAGAALAALAVVGLFLEFHPSRRDVTVSRPAVTDAVLMEQVKLELSRSVPGPMQPLENLMDAQ